MKYAYAALAAVIAAFALLIYFAPEKPLPAQPTLPEVRNHDQSLTIATEAASKPAKRRMAASGTIERQIDITIQPNASECASMAVTIDLVRQDDVLRVIASSPDGRVITGRDMVFTLPEPEKKWAAGISYDTRRHGGLWIDRDFHDLRIGAAVKNSDNGLQAEARIGWRF